jgi:hypothetical protein
VCGADVDGSPFGLVVCDVGVVDVVFVTGCESFGFAVVGDVVTFGGG